ncbi:MAG: hypothetical protein MZW92_74525 [Comamonadaceae bacterium]|nr:hypothetical protein [Comamonadaceae bacterium]
MRAAYRPPPNRNRNPSRRRRLPSPEGRRPEEIFPCPTQHRGNNRARCCDCRLRDRRRDCRTAGAGRPPALRDPRRHRDGRVAAADRRQHPAARSSLPGCRRAAARRQGRQRRVHARDAAAARALAQALVQAPRAAPGCRRAALVTDMNQVLGRSAGNALEVAECPALLRGEPGDARAAST